MTRRVLLFLAALAVLPYLRAFSLPFISDDYVLLVSSQKWGPWSGWGDLARDPLFRCRTSTMILTYWWREWFGLWPPAFYFLTVALHVLNTWLVAGLGSWSRIGWRISIPAAAWFALHEIKQEAVLWYASVPELLCFACGVLSLLALRRWLERADAKWYAASLGCYALALLSKESAVVFGPLCAVLLWSEGRLRKRWRSLAPFALIAVAYAIPIFMASDTHRHLNDGTFTWGWHFPLVMMVSSGRLLWFWGALALIVLLSFRTQASWRTVLAGAAWTLLCLLPYAFLTYMPRIPSRHNYLASAGVALIGGAAWLLVSCRWKRAAWALAAVFVLHNTLYVWIVKHPQFLSRAQPTEQLAAWVERHPGPFWLRCFPFSPLAARYTIQARLPSRFPDLHFGDAPSGARSVCIGERGLSPIQP